MSKGQYIGYCRFCKQQTMLQIDDVVAEDYENNPKNGKLISKRKLQKCKCQEHLPGEMLKEGYATQKTGA